MAQHMTLPDDLRAQHRRDEAGEAARQRLSEAWQAAPEPLLALLTADEAIIRTLAADAIGRVGDARAVDALIARLPQADAAETGHIIEALVALGKRHPATLTASLPAVEPLLTHTDMWLRVAAGEAVAHLARQQPRAAQMAVPAMLNALLMAERQAAYDLVISALIGIGPNAIPPLAEQLNADDAHIQQQAAYILEQIAAAHPTHAERITQALKAWQA